MNYINIPLLKIIINNFLYFESENNILDIISKAINIYNNKDIFYFIYKKMSILFRKHNIKNTDINFIKQFEKIFEIWKLLYNIELLFPNFQNKNLFFSKIKEDTKNIIINIGDKIKKAKLRNETDSYFIIIDLVSSPFLNLNKLIDKFYFIKLFNDKGEEFGIKYEDIFNINNKFNISNVNNITIELMNSKCTITINNDKKKIKIEKKTFFNFNSIRKFEILNNFFGEITSIIIDKFFIKIPDNTKDDVNKIEQEELKIEINKKDCQVNLNIFLDEKPRDCKDKNLIQYNGEIFNDDYLNKVLKLNNKIDLCKIKYYGGINSFIPIFKLIKYTIQIINIINKDEKKDLNENIIDFYLKKTIIWIKDILIIILKMICISNSNYQNFQRIKVPLIGSIAEVIYSLPVLPNNYRDLLLKDEIFFIFYILILNSTYANNIKKIFKNLFKIEENFKDFNFTMELMIIEINQNIDLDWYFQFLFNFILFIMLYFCSIKKIPQNLINHLNKIYSSKKEFLERQNNSNIEIFVPFIDFIKVFYLGEEKNINELFKIYHNKLKENQLYLGYIVSMIRTLLNAKNSSKSMKFELNSNIYVKIEQLIVIYIFDEYKGLSNSIVEKEKKLKTIIDNFKDYIDNKDFLLKIFSFLLDEDFTPKNKLIMKELIDYHGQYHHIMKELFIFNRLLSNQNLFFKDSLSEIKKSNLKFKNINYYTRNFQRPLLYPYLDYRDHYPNFSRFKIENNHFYKAPESKDVYNFKIICHELDDLIKKYDEEMEKTIEKPGVINFFKNICLVKQAYHIKGSLFTVKDEIKKKIIIYFYSDPYDSQTKSNPCNKKPDGKNKNNLCYGPIFICPEKEGNRKIMIDFDNVRLLLKRIYFYRHSAIEIFTETK